MLSSTAFGFTLSQAQTNVSCNGGSNGTASVVASGGAPPYTYSWSPSGGTNSIATGLTAQSYTVTVTDSLDEMATANFTLTQPPALNATSVVTNIACNGGNTGAINLTPSGGTPGYTFSWSDGATTEDRTGRTAGTYSVTVTDANSCTKVANITVTQPPALSATTVVTNVACNGGTTGAINLTPSGGTPGYTFSWSDGATTEDRTGRAAGAYSVTVTDANSCTKVANVTLTQPPALNANLVVTNVACFGGNTGAINLTPNGGTPGYTFNWSDGATTEDRTGRTAGTYSVTVTDANACTKVANVTVTQPAAPVSGTTVVTNVACFGGNTGAINLTPTGGVGPYTFNWAGGPTTEDRTSLTAGAYSVVVTDANGCSGTVAPTVTQPASAVSSNAVVTNVACNGGNTGAINLTPTGGVGPYMFNWAGGPTTEDRTSLTAGAYPVTVTDANGCTGAASYTVTQPPALNANLVVTNVACFGGNTGAINLTPNGGTPGYTFSWSDGATTEDHTGRTADTYSVTVTDANACTKTVNATLTQPATAVSASNGVVTNVACNGGNNGAINLTPAGGVGPYTFNWASGQTTEDRVLLTAGAYPVVVTDANGCTGSGSFTVTQPPSISFTAASQTNVACHGGNTGAFAVNPATGGIAPFTYDWSAPGHSGTSASALAADTYSVTATDSNGCTSTIAFTLTEPPALQTSTSKTDVACNGESTGSAAVNATGGTPGFTYDWAPSGSTVASPANLAAGTHTVTVTDANGCQKTDSVTLTEPSAIITAGSQTNVSCHDGANGTATVSPTGGAGAYTYQWSNNATTQTATGLIAQAYSVTVTDANNCHATKTFDITEPAALVATPGVQTNILCAGGNNGSASVSVTGGTGGYAYSWLPTGGTGPTANGLTANSYTVTVQDQNGCQTGQSFTLTEPPPLVASPVSQTNLACAGDNSGAATVSASGGTGSYAYNWLPLGGTAASALGLAAAVYTATVTDSNNCTATQSFTLTQPPELTLTVDSQSGPVCIDDTNGSATASAMGGTGALSFEWSNGEVTSSVSGLAAGTYTVTATDANACQKTVQVELSTQAPLSLTQTQTDVSCAGANTGAATVIVDGGAGNYTYLWTGDPTGNGTNSVSGLTAGTYSVTVTDSASSCVATATFNITEPPALVANGTLTNPSAMNVCDGTAQVAPSGGVAPYDVSWAPNAATGTSVSNQCAGMETATITDSNGCHATYTANFSAPTVDVSLALTGANDAVLAGGTATLTAHVASTPDALGVSVSVAIPSGLTVENVAAPNGFICTSLPLTTNVLTCATSTLVNGAGEDVVITVRVAELFGHGMLTVNASATSAYNELAPANNAANTVLDIISPSKLVAQKTVEAVDANNLRYTITVRNDGPAAALDLPASDEAADALPEGLTLVSASADGGAVMTTGNHVSWNGTLRANEAVAITVNASIDATVADGTTISNTATVNYDVDGDGAPETTDHSAAATHVVSRDGGTTGGGTGATGGGSGGGGGSNGPGCGCTSGGELVGLWLVAMVLSRRRARRQEETDISRDRP